MNNRYDPNQRRVPAGHEGGGRWTRQEDMHRTIDRNSGESHQSEASELAEGHLDERGSGSSDPNGSFEGFAGPLARYAAGTLRVAPSKNPTTLDDIARLSVLPTWLYSLFYRTPNEHERPEHKVLDPSIEDLFALYTHLSARNSYDRKTIITFESYVYEPDPADSSRFVEVRTLTTQELEDLCKCYGLVQSLTDAAANEARFTNLHKDPKGFGNVVHRDVDKMIKSLNYPNLKSEVSTLKGIWEGIPPVKEEMPLRKKGWIRVDALEYREDGTVCVYDIKTGPTGMNKERRDEIVREVYKAFKNRPVTRIIVTELRPRQPDALLPLGLQLGRDRRDSDK